MRGRIEGGVVQFVERIFRSEDNSAVGSRRDGANVDGSENVLRARRLWREGEQPGLAEGGVDAAVGEVDTAREDAVFIFDNADNDQPAAGDRGSVGVNVSQRVGAGQRSARV